MTMIQVALTIDGKPVGAGIFEVLPRLGEWIYVMVRFDEDSRDISGRVSDVRHETVVRMDGSRLDPCPSVTLCLTDARVQVVTEAPEPS